MLEDLRVYVRAYLCLLSLFVWGWVWVVHVSGRERIQLLGFTLYSSHSRSTWLNFHSDFDQFCSDRLTLALLTKKWLKSVKVHFYGGNGILFRLCFHVVFLLFSCTGPRTLRQFVNNVLMKSISINYGIGDKRNKNEKWREKDIRWWEEEMRK